MRVVPGAVIALIAVTVVPCHAAGIWISAAEIAALPTQGQAWESLLAEANRATDAPNLSNGDDPTNVAVLAKALVYARTGETRYRDEVVNSCMAAIGTQGGSTLALGRELLAYVLAADLVGLPSAEDSRFRTWLAAVRNEPIAGRTLISTHETRPNNWGTHAGASRIAAALYLGDRADVERAAAVFHGWLGDRAAYSGFSYGALSWQADPSKPVGINPAGATRDGFSIDGVLPDDQRRAGGFAWPPPKENYVYEALQGALAQAVLLARAGYAAWDWEDRALLRAFRWLHEQAQYSAAGDDSWQPHVVNSVYGTDFPAPVPSRAGKNVGWTDWTHGDGGSSGGGGGSEGGTLCTAAPRSSACSSARGSAFSLARVRATGLGKIRWTWSGRSALGRAGWGNPLMSTKYELCAYDSASVPPRLGLTIALPAGQAWSVPRQSRLRYRVRQRSTGTFTSGDLRETADASEKIRLRARSEALGLAAVSGLSGSLDVTVELVTSDGSCWHSRFARSESRTVSPAPESIAALR
jgi:hypothetical protein